MPPMRDRNVAPALMDSQTILTGSNLPTPLNSKKIHVQSPHTSTDHTSPTHNSQTLTSSNSRTATSTATVARPTVDRRTSTITWHDTHETNTTTVTVPPILKKEVASSKAGRIKPTVEKLASWFKGSPVNLEEIEEAREDDRKWKRRVREWKEMKDEVDSIGGSISEKEFVGKGRKGSIRRARRRLSCW